MVSKKDIIQIIPKTANLPNVPIGSTMSAFQMLIKTHHEYKVVAAQEKTKRMAITSWEKTRLTELANQKELLKTHLTHTFQERKEVINNFFHILDKGLDNHDAKTIDVALSGLVNIIQTSPLKDIDKLMSSLNNQDTKLIEF